MDRTVQKRRPRIVIQNNDSASININAVNFENIDPNIKTQSTIFIGNDVNQTSHVTTQGKHGYDKSSGCNRAASNSHQKSNINAPQDKYSTKRVNEIILTPSQRRLAGVDLSGISYQSGIGRAIQRKTNINSNVNPFHLPSSRISPLKKHSSTKCDRRLLDSFNRDRCLQVNSSLNLLHRKSNNFSSDSRSYINNSSVMDANPSRSSNNKSNRDDDITVVVPELEHLDWYRSGTGSGVKNLLDAFNDVQTPEFNKGKNKPGTNSIINNQSTSTSRNEGKAPVEDDNVFQTDEILDIDESITYVEDTDFGEAQDGMLITLM
ncbi:hypothetical protein POM88_044078 [Heracleum sosnowskyi]|uniref:Uncharacterized protein n=1 Tax=Heracleum sosnowskyi TaxID=360622 RepID=A0AAD8H372_9APIA|nr:hypothetical protein POM88_044078 [Heracleum sosnowskyi]